MKNKIRLKRCLILELILCVVCVFVLLYFQISEYRTYTKNYNNSMNAVLSKVLEKYPEVDEIEIARIINSTNNNSDAVLKRYGIDSDEQSVILANDNEHRNYMIKNMTVLIFAMAGITCVFLFYEKGKSKELNNIIKYIEQINRKNYDLDIDTISEDELSILKNEIYKTTIMLKEAAENSNTDKVNLKKSLEDISHQLKTPLTSVLVMLDNLIDDPEMKQEIREDFIKSIKRELVNISFLVQEILKLSKFDSNTIRFFKKDVSIKDIVEESVRNVSAICDLKNIEIDVKGTDNPIIVCDKKWQVEAVTNIIKNCIEHSHENSVIHIEYSDNNVYSMIKIRDEGEGISKQDLPHVFERFYKGENSKSDSVGIGLALAKTIIEEDNGMISVKSDDRGTEFAIKYMKFQTI